MPVTKSAKKKLRKDRKRTIRNKILKERYKRLLKKALKDPKEENIRRAVSAIDKAAKRHVIHKNKAARLKSRVMKAITSKTSQKSKTEKHA